MYKTILSTLTVALALFAADEARADFARCDGCTAMQMRASAEGLGNGEHYIYSLPGTRVVRTYNVTTAEGMPLANPITTPTIVVDIVDGLKQIHSASGGTMKYVVTVPWEDVDYPGTINSAYQLAASSSLRLAQLPDHIAINPPMTLDHTVASLVTAGLAYFGLQDAAELNYIIEFPDGTSVKYDYILGDSTATYRQNSLLGAGDQLIPLNTDGADGEEWTGNGLNEFVDYLSQHLGANIAANGSGYVIENVRCNWNDATNTLHCTISYRMH